MDSFSRCYDWSLLDNWDGACTDYKTINDLLVALQLPDTPTWTLDFISLTTPKKGRSKMTSLTVVSAIVVLFCVVCLTEGAKPTRRRRQVAAAKWPAAPAAPAGASMPQPYQRYAFVPVDALGRPQMVYPVNPLLPPQPYPPQPVPQFLPPPVAPPPRTVVFPPPAPPRRIVVQAPPPVQPQVVVVPAPPHPECGTIAKPGECCSNALTCPEMFQVDEEGLTCAHKGPAAVCCMPNICD